jgi:catechol 2,3-dioxygenase-like lactoylglutathione lyase family enzyme
MPVSEANLTRFGPVTAGFGAAKTVSATFKAMPGPAQVVLLNSGVEDAQLRVNGWSVLARHALRGRGESVIPVELETANTIELKILASDAGSCTLRVTQRVNADIGLLRQGYFGLNTSDMTRQRQFYNTLGFKGEIYPAGPQTSTTFARALGFKDDYLIHVALTSLENPPTPPFVDTVQFRGASFRDEPPYAHLNHIGMTYATYSTRDLDGDYARLRSAGIGFLSAPATAPDGERFVFFKDPDGAFLKLVEIAAGESAAPGPGLIRLVNTNMNVSDFERSREFYRMLGFTKSINRSLEGAGAFAAAHGFHERIEFVGEDISLGEGTDGATLQLRQWKQPFDPAPPYPPPVNHLGIDRINFYVQDLTAAIASLRVLGFEPVWPIGGGPDFGLVFFFDPDGIKVQIAGPRTDRSAG